MRRIALGVFALLFLAASVVGLFQAGVAGGQASMATSISLRVGLVSATSWLAYPQLRQLARKFPPWLMVSSAFGLVILLIQPKFFRLVCPLLVVVIAFQFVSQLFLPPTSKARSVRDSHADPTHRRVSQARRDCPKRFHEFGGQLRIK